MTQAVLRLLIKEKLDAGCLPYDSLPPYSGGPGHGETCDACEETATVEQHVIANLDAAGAAPCRMFPSLERRATTSTQPQAAWGRACRQRKLDAGTAVKIRDLTRRGGYLTLRLGVLNVTSHDIFNDV